MGSEACRDCRAERIMSFRSRREGKYHEDLEHKLSPRESCIGQFCDNYFSQGLIVMSSSKEESEFRSMEDLARTYVDFVERRYRSALSSDSKINTYDRKAFEKRLINFRCAFADLAEFIERTRHDAPNSLNFIYQLIHSLISASILLGSAGGTLEEARKFHLEPMKTGGAIGGKNSARTRAKKEDAGKKIAKPMIEAPIAKDRKMSLDKIALEVCCNWKHKKPKEPGHGSLKEFASEIKKEVP